MPPGTSEEIADWRGVIKSTEPGAQYDDYFELWTNGQIIYFGIDSMEPTVKSQIEALRDCIDACDAEAVVSGTPIDLAALLRVNKPVLRARYEFADVESPGLAGALREFLREQRLA